MRPGINKILRYYYISYWTGSLALGLLMPFVSVFALQQISGGSAEVVGFAAGIFWFFRACFQIPGGIILDKLSRRNQKTQLYFFCANLFAEAILIFGFLLIHLPWQLYFLQALRATFTGFTAPSVGTILSANLDKGHEGKEWGFWGAISGLCFGISGALAGIIVSRYGFSSLFVIAGSIHFLAALISLVMLKSAKFNVTKSFLVSLKHILFRE